MLVWCDSIRFDAPVPYLYLQALGGYWYSMPAAGECKGKERPGKNGTGCTWRTVKEDKWVNSSCVNANIDRLVEAHGTKCFKECAEPTNEKTACYAKCFAQTVNGNEVRCPASPYLNVHRYIMWMHTLVLMRVQHVARATQYAKRCIARLVFLWCGVVCTCMCACACACVWCGPPQTAKIAAMPRDVVVAPFLAAFASDDPAKNGCPNLKKKLRPALHL